MKIELEKYGIQMPAFSKIGGILANELSVDEAACKQGATLWVQMGLLLPPSIRNTVMVPDVRSFASKLRSVEGSQHCCGLLCYCYLEVSDFDENESIRK